MKIQFWGVRGSLGTPPSPTTISEKIKQALKHATISDILCEESVNHFVDSLPFGIKSFYGGNTTCLQVESSQGELMILDCGSGLRNLGNVLMTQSFGKGLGEAIIYLSHTHWDHIQGIPFFVPFFIPGNRFHFYSAYPDLEDRLIYQQARTHFPLAFHEMQSQKSFHLIDPSGHYSTAKGLRFRIHQMYHPGKSFAIRIEENERSFIYGSDAEFNVNTIERIEEFRSFFENADVLVFDTQYTFSDAIQKIDWGHSNSSIAIDIAGRFNVKTLVLFHHDPSYSDQALDELHMKALRYRDMNPRRSSLEIITAYEGLEINL